MVLALNDGHPASRETDVKDECDAYDTHATLPRRGVKLLPAIDKHSLHFETLIEYENVGAFGLFKASRLAGDSSALGGGEAGHADHLMEFGGRVLHHLSHHVIHALDGAGETAVGTLRR